MNIRLTVVCGWLLSLAMVGPLFAADPPEQPLAKRTPAAESTLQAFKQLRQALKEWRAELGDEGTVDPEVMNEVRQQFFGLARELEPLVDKPRPKRPTPDAPAATAADQQKAWIDAIRAVGKKAEAGRAAAIAELQTALAGDDLPLKLAALQTLTQTGDIKYERAPFRALVLATIESGEPGLQIAAWYALYNSGREAGDLARLQTAHDRDPKVLAPSISHLLFSFGDGVMDGRSAEIVLEQLASADHNNVREALRGLWGAKVTPELATRLIELAEDPATHHDAIYFGLSTLAEKNEEVVDTLIATLADPDWINNGGRALWGLQRGVPESQQAKVAEALVELHNSRTDRRVRDDCERLVRQYGGQEMAKKLEK